MSYLEWEGGFAGLEKIDGIGSILGIVDGQMHEARAAIDRNRLRASPSAVCSFGRCFTSIWT